MQRTAHATEERTAREDQKTEVWSDRSNRGCRVTRIISSGRDGTRENSAAAKNKRITFKETTEEEETSGL